MFTEEYLRSISAVDSILNLDRMRQSVHVREEQMKSRTRGTLNRNYVQPGAAGLMSGPSGAMGSMGGFMRKTLSVPNISQLFIPSATSTNNLLAASKQSMAQTNGNGAVPGFHSSSAGASPAVPDYPNLSGHGVLRRQKPIRSESLANLSGFTSPTGGSLFGTAGLLSPSQQQQQQQQNLQQSQQSPQSRPSSLNLGTVLFFISPKRTLSAQQKTIVIHCVFIQVIPMLAV